nr:WD40 repeat domain-containing protein [Brevundimonas sp.]
RAFSFLSNGQLLATSGAQGAVLWPFVGANGPMGREATEIGFDEGSLVALVASQPKRGLLAAGLSDGRVWLADPAGQGLNFLKADKGSPITALAMSADARRVAWADEDGNAGVADI